MEGRVFTSICDPSQIPRNSCPRRLDMHARNFGLSRRIALMESNIFTIDASFVLGMYASRQSWRREADPSLGRRCQMGTLTRILVHCTGVNMLVSTVRFEG